MQRQDKHAQGCDQQFGCSSCVNRAPAMGRLAEPLRSGMSLTGVACHVHSIVFVGSVTHGKSPHQSFEAWTLQPINPHSRQGLILP